MLTFDIEVRLEGRVGLKRISHVGGGHLGNVKLFSGTSSCVDGARRAGLNHLRRIVLLLRGRVTMCCTRRSHEWESSAYIENESEVKESEASETKLSRLFGVRNSELRAR